MRITNNLYAYTLMDHISRLTGRLNQLESQAATGQKIVKASDNPTAMARVLSLQHEYANLIQFGDNIQVLKEIAHISFSAIEGLKKIVDRATEIAVLADNTKSSEELRTYATEIDQLINQAVQFANTRYRSQFIFAGTKTDQMPFTPITNDAGQIIAVSYNGATTSRESIIGEELTITVQVPGANTQGTGQRALLYDERYGVDLFGHLIALRDSLLLGDVASINNEILPQLQKDEENLLYHIAFNGVQQSRLDMVDAIRKSRIQAIDEEISSEVDADLTQTIVRLNQTQTAYMAALQSAAFLLNNSLLNYIK